MSTDRNTAAAPETPALYAALRHHTASVANELRRVRITGGRMATRWERRDGRTVAFLALTLPEGTAPETLARARTAAAEMLISVGFYVGGIATEPHTIAVTGYYGRAIPSASEAA